MFVLLKKSHNANIYSAGQEGKTRTNAPVLFTICIKANNNKQKTKQ